MSTIDISQNPYFDDFDESKGYYKILFRPGKAVQGRELTQIQSILQNQITRFGGHIFENGSMVRGAATTLETEGVYYIKIEPTFNELEVDLSTFIGKFITDTSGLGIRAYVIAAQEATDVPTPKTLIVKYVSSVQVDGNSIIDLQTEDTLYTATTWSTAPVVGNASICSIDDGTFFISGYFAKVNAQTLILDAYGTTPSYKVGLELETSIVDEKEDSSLLDPALGSSNYQAPGATRYKVALILAKRSLTSTDDSLFIEVLRVENGVLTQKLKYPVYSDLETTLARRTFDESGNYTVRPFHIAIKPHDTYSNAYNIILETGKAYVMGYEFETAGPTTIKSERARDVANVFNYNLTVDYQNYIDCFNLKGPLPLSTLTPLTMHCVSGANVNTQFDAVASSTIMGTIRIRALEYESSANGTSIGTGIYRAYVWDANTVSRTAANAVSGSSTTIQFDANASRANNAYQGVKVRIVNHAGTPLNETHRIASYDGVGMTATLEAGDSWVFGTPTSATQFVLDFEMKDAESFVLGPSSNVINTMLSVSSDSKLSLAEDVYQGTYITDTNFNRLLFPLPYSVIAPASVIGGTPITNTEYFGRKLYTGQSFSSNVITISTVTGITSAVNGSPLSGSDAIDNIFLVITNPGTGTLANNQVVNFLSASNTATITTAANSSTYTITVPGAQNATASVYVKVKLPFSHTLANLRKSKFSILANTANVYLTSPTVIASGISFYSQAAGANGVQIVFDRTAISTLQTPNAPQSVYVADAIRLAKVMDFGTLAVTQANLASATDITANYTFDSGQKDNAYDHASIRLNPTAKGPTGNTVVYIDYLNHSGIGYLTVDSYSSANIAYENIPTYTSPTSGRVYSLRDVIDFRPRRKNADTIGEFDETIFGISGTSFETDFSNYLSRVDKVVLTKDKTFEVVSGVSALLPTPPADKDNGMTLYTLSLPAYTANTSDIGIKYVDNRRYTMRDIGNLEQRISKLEYYTSLNLLEKAAKDQEVQDDAGLSRFKNGILVDPFTGHGIGDVKNPDYSCSIDGQAQELRAPFTANSITLEVNTSGSTNYTRNGAVFTLPYTEATLVDQPYAALALNINPFNTVAFIGQIKLDPSSDVWVDVNQKPDVLVNLEGDYDAWKLLTDPVAAANPGNIFGTSWNSWQTTWTGISNQRTEVLQGETRQYVGDTGIVFAETPIISRDIVDVTQQQVRLGTRSTFAPETITRSIGNKVTDVSIVPYIRYRGVFFSGRAFLPNTALYAFFDDTNVQNFINRANIVELASNSATYIDTYQGGETLRVYDATAGTNLAFGQCVRVQNGAATTNVYVISISYTDINKFRFKNANATFLIGQTSGSNTRISGYHHYSGQCISGSTANTIVLQPDIIGSNTTNLTGQPIYFTGSNDPDHFTTSHASAVGLSGTIASFNVSTGIATLTTPLAQIPNNYTTYSIGQLSTDPRGECHGIFSVPSTPTVRFRTGERIFRLIDTLTNDLAGSLTNGDVKYFAQGLLQTQDDTIISTRVPAITRTTLTQSQQVVSSVVTRETISGSSTTVLGYWDPLAQTFLIDQRTHPSGVQLTGVRLIFKTKDPDVPLQVQIRPVVNGFPHSSMVIPGSDIVVSPNDIIEVSEDLLKTQYANTSSNNPLDNPLMYTQINFNHPLYLQPGAEYAIILIANSIKYQVYASQLGSNILGTNRLISSQPYLGSLFKSQNATLWTPVQEQDLTFRLLNAQYNINVTGNVEFQVAAIDAPANTTPIPMDVFYVTSGNLLLPNTTINSLVATTLAANTKEVARSFQVDENTFFDDTLGRRMITTDPTSFKVRFLLGSQNPDISPVIDKDRLSVLAIENRINNGGLSNSSIVILNSTSTYVGSNISVAISGGGGSGANAYAIVTANAISSIIVDTPGSGYTGTPTITITGGGGSANAVVVGEDQANGGPATAKYITRKVTLADGMDAGDFRVYFSAYRPAQSTIDVYYKILSADDSDTFDEKGYQLMTIIQGYNNISLNSKDIKDFVYAPGASNIANNSVSYETFTDFKYFAIKIVMKSSDTTRVPRIRDFRVIAFPSAL